MRYSSIYFLISVCLVGIRGAYAEVYHPKSLNTIPDYLVGCLRTHDAQATQQYLLSEDLNTDILELTYSDGHVVWYYVTSIAKDIYQMVSVDKATGKRENLIRVKGKNGDDVYLSHDTVEQIRELDLSRLPTELSSSYSRTNSSPLPMPLEPDQPASNTYDKYDDSGKKVSSLVCEGDNWWPYALIGGGSVIALGAYGIYYLFTNTATGSRYLRRNDLWSMWRPDEPYEVLLLLEPQDMAQDLMHDITIRYPDATNLMQCFLEDLQEEYDTLLQWLQFRKQLAPWCISLGGAFDMIEHRLMLLDRMRDAVYYWRAEQLRNSQS